MSVILVVSVLIRTVAIVWSIIVARRLSDKRVLFLTAMLVLMTMRQALTLTFGMSADPSINLDLTIHLDEFPGLCVSLMAFLIVLNLEDLAFQVSHTARKTIPSSRRLVVPAMAIGLASIIGVMIIGYFAYQSSRDAIRETVAAQNRALGRTVSNAALRDMKQSGRVDEKMALERIGQVWQQTELPYQQIYLCVIGSAGKLEWHSLKPEMKGTDVSQVVVSEHTRDTVLQLLESKQGWHGQNTNFRGVSQLVGYHYEPSIDSLVAVHIPAAVVDDGIRKAVAPWIGGMALIGGLLLPFSLGLLFRSSRQEHAIALANVDALTESEKRYRLLVENSPFCIHQLTTTGQLSSMNAAGLAMMDKQSETKICGVDYLSVVHPEDQAQVAHYLQQAAEGTTSQFSFRSSNNQYFESCFAPIKDRHGAVQRIMGITRDVSEQKRAEQSLKESERLFRTIFEHAAVGVAQIDSVTGTLLRMNQRYCDIVGVSNNALIGKTWMELTPPDDLAEDLDKMNRLRAGDIREYTIEKHLRHSDGSDVHVNLTVSPMWQPGEQPSTHIAIVEDISGRKASEIALRVSEERYRSLVISSAATVWITDPQGAYSVPQPAWEEFTGQTWEEHEQFGWANALHPEDRDRMANDWQRATQTPGPFFTEGRIFHAASGKHRFCEVRASPVFNADGTVREWSGTTIDVHDRWLAEHKLREQHEMNQRLLSTMLDGFVLGDSDGKIVDVNAAYCEMVGYSREELLRMNIVELDDSLGQDEMAWKFEELMQIGSNRIETTHRHKDGHLIELDVSSTVLAAQSDARPMVASFARDITARKQAERDLRLTKSSVDACSTAIFWIRRDASFAYVNDAVVQRFGYTRDEFLSMCAHDLDERNTANVWDRLWGLTQRNPTLAFKTHIRHKDGSLSPVEVTVHLVGFEGDEFLFAFATDISQRQLAEASLRKSRERLRKQFAEVELIYRTARVGLCLLDTELKFVRINEELAGMNGCSVEQHVGKTVQEVLPDLADQLEPIYRRVLETGDATLNVSVERVDPENPGETLYYLANYHPFKDSDGKVIGVSAVVQDITEQKNAEGELLRVQEKIAHVSRVNTMAEMAVGISHELNQPLSAIANYAQACTKMLKTGSATAMPDVVEYLAQITEMAHQSGQVMRGLRDFTRRRPRQPVATAIGQLIQSTLDMLSFELRKSKVTVEFRKSEPDVELIVDPIQIRQVLLNLLNNSIAAMMQTPVDDRILRICMAIENDALEVQIIDHGSGIASEQLGHLFEPFFTSKPHGSGIGLAISLRIIRAHKGTLTGINNQPKGATFKFTLPLDVPL